jgi:hypothetical protein
MSQRSCQIIDCWGTDIVCTKWNDKTSGESTYKLVRVLFPILA